jgi:chitinase
MAAAAVGAIPITSFVWGDTFPNVDSLGGLWWGGDLKGLFYNLFAKDAELNGGTPVMMNKVDDLGIMTYDMCADETVICQPYPDVTDLSLSN